MEEDYTIGSATLLEREEVWPVLRKGALIAYAPSDEAAQELLATIQEGNPGNAGTVEWISTQERLPEPSSEETHFSRRVLFYTTGLEPEEAYQLGIYSVRGEFWISDREDITGAFDSSSVSHWAELSPPSD